MTYSNARYMMDLLGQRERLERELRRLKEGAIPVRVRYGRQGGFEILPNDLPKRWVRDNPDEWIPAYLVKREVDDG